MSDARGRRCDSAVRGLERKAGAGAAAASRASAPASKLALDAGVTILSGSDVGVFTHGENARRSS